MRPSAIGPPIDRWLKIGCGQSWSRPFAYSSLSGWNILHGWSWSVEACAVSAQDRRSDQTVVSKSSSLISVTTRSPSPPLHCSARCRTIIHGCGRSNAVSAIPKVWVSVVQSGKKRFIWVTQNSKPTQSWSQGLGLLLRWTPRFLPQRWP